MQEPFPPGGVIRPTGETPQIQIQNEDPAVSVATGGSAASASGFILPSLSDQTSIGSHGGGGSVIIPGDASTVTSETMVPPPAPTATAFRPPSPTVSITASVISAATNTTQPPTIEMERQNPFENPPLITRHVNPSLSVLSAASSETSNSLLLAAAQLAAAPTTLQNSMSGNSTATSLSGAPVITQQQPPLHTNEEPYDLSYENPFPINSTTSSEVEDDDEDTAPSSQQNPSTDGTPDENNTTETPLQRLIATTKKRFGRRDSEDDENQGVLIAGYLQKLGRNGKWQCRWFETDGECLSYYKSSKRVKCLATLDLQKVGLIQMDPDDPSECGFKIEVLGRSYHLRADSRASCKDWVIMLNRVKEARLEQGNVKLVDWLDAQKTPRVVVVGYRDRTSAVDQDDDQWDRIMLMGTNPPHATASDPSTTTASAAASLSQSVVGRWTKRRTTLQRLGTKLSRWARSLKKYSCAEMEQERIFLDRHVHPPGHDDNNKKKSPKRTRLQDRSTSNSSDYDRRMIS